MILGFWDFWETCSQNTKIPISQNHKITKSQNKNKRFCVFFGYWKSPNPKKTENLLFMVCDFLYFWETCSQNPNIPKYQNPKTIRGFASSLTVWEIIQIPKRLNTFLFFGIFGRPVARIQKPQNPKTKIRGFASF